MKRKNLLRVILSLILVTGMSVLFSSCETEWYDGPGPGYGPGYGTFNDRNLQGYWALVQINSVDVAPDAQNYLYFNGRGYGQYYYWQNGRRYTENTQYWSQYSNSGVSDYQINLQYQNGDISTMNYWFTNGGNSLWFQWRQNGRVMTYVYDAINYAPW